MPRAPRRAPRRRGAAAALGGLAAAAALRGAPRCAVPGAAAPPRAGPSAARELVLDQHGPGRPRVVALLASHLGDEDRLWKLERCLQSIAAQEEPPAEVLVRWSAAGAELEAQACELLDGCGLPCALTAWRAEPAAQFEHYAALGSRLLSGRPAAELDEAWLIFSDDDDIWHPRRAAHFSRAAAAAAGCGGLAAGVFRDARPRDPGARPRSAGDVEALLRSGLAEQTGDTELMGAGFRLEYFHYCVRPALLAAFLQRAPAALLSSPYCDLALAEFARLASWANGPPPLHDPGRDDWMYYYDRRPGADAREVAGSEPGEAEERCLAQHRADVEALGIPAEDALWTLARVRTNVDLMLLETWPRCDGERVLSVLVPMLLDREGADLEALSLQSQELRGWRAPLEEAFGAGRARSAELLGRFYLELLVERYNVVLRPGSGEGPA